MVTSDWELRIKKKEQDIYRVARNLLESEAKRQTYRLYIGLGTSVYLSGVEENIALWAYTYLSPHDSSERFVYLYTDLNGVPLFNGKLFKYATTFSNGKALVFDFDSTNRPYIIDIHKNEIINLPPYLGWKQLSNFKNNRLSIKGDNNNWGSIILNEEERLMEYEIPFIWNYLASSKRRNIVYAGRTFEYTIFPNQENGPYAHMVADRDKSVDCSCIKLARMTVKEAKDLNRFKVVESYLNPEEWRRSTVTAYMHSFVKNPGDELFRELHDEELCLTDGSIIDLGSLKDYKPVTYKLKK